MPTGRRLCVRFSETAESPPNASRLQVDESLSPVEAVLTYSIATDRPHLRLMYIKVRAHLHAGVRCVLCCPVLCRLGLFWHGAASRISGT